MSLVDDGHSGYLQQALEMITELVADYPTNIDYQDALVCSLLLNAQSNYSEDPLHARQQMRQAYDEALALKERLPKPCLHWRHVGYAAQCLAVTYLEEGELTTAEEWATIALDATESFLQRPDFDPQELIDLAGCQLLMRRVALYRGDEATAHTWAERWRAHLEAAAEKYPDFFVFTEQLARADEFLATDSVTVK